MQRLAPPFRPIAPIANLTGSLADTLQARIEGGELAPGQQLPTEQAIVASTGVSRTVVREALATLRARGLIVTRQGRGAFVAARAAAPPTFVIPQPVVDAGPFAEVLGVLELRLGIETEAAALAAERRGDEDLARLEAHLDALDRSGDRPDVRAEHDFAFHRALLAATRNGYFPQIFDVLGNLVFSRQKQRLDDMAAAEPARYLRRLGVEHRAILAAVRAKDAAGARRAMRVHLAKAHARYRSHAGAGEADASPADGTEPRTVPPE